MTFKMMEQFLPEHRDYPLVAEYLSKTFPTLTEHHPDYPERQARLYITERDKAGYTITGYGHIASSDGLSGFYQITLDVYCAMPPKSVYLVSIDKIISNDIGE